MTAVADLRKYLSKQSDHEVVGRCEAKRKERVQMWNDGSDRTVRWLIQQNGLDTHPYFRLTSSSKLHKIRPLIGSMP